MILFFCLSPLDEKANGQEIEDNGFWKILWNQAE